MISASPHGNYSDVLRGPSAVHGSHVLTALLSPTAHLLPVTAPHSVSSEIPIHPASQTRSHRQTQPSFARANPTPITYSYWPKLRTRLVPPIQPHRERRRHVHFRLNSDNRKLGQNSQDSSGPTRQLRRPPPPRPGRTPRGRTTTHLCTQQFLFAQLPPSPRRPN